MNADIAPVAESDKPALWAMLQTYIAELAPFAGVKPTDGVYAYALFESYWTDADRSAHWLVISGVKAGFALLWHDREHGVWRMAEFFVALAQRRAGLGIWFARTLIAQHPGHWKIRQIARNEAAVVFWQRALAPYHFTETIFVDRGLARVEQSFSVEGSHS